MQTVVKWLTQPYPFDGTWREHLRSALYGGLFVFLFLLVFQPFGIRVPENRFWEAALTFSYFGLVTTGVLVIAAVIMRLIPSFFNENGWVIWKEIVTNILFVMMIGTANMVLAAVIFNSPLTWETFWVWQKMTFIIGIFPILFGTYTKQQILGKRHVAGADQLNVKIAGYPKIADDKPLTLEGDNQNESLSLHPDDFLYIEAADNYVRIFFYENGQIENSMLRSSLKKMEQQLTGHPQFFRCHRTFVVNLDKVKHVSGNAQGYKLHLEKGETLIPVSRSLNEEIVERFK